MKGFKGAWVLLKKDFFSFYRSWVGVLVLFAFLLVAGIFFTLFVLGYSSLSVEAARQGYEGLGRMNLTGFVMGAFLLNLGVLFLFLAPLMSMRSLAEEKRSGTLELLYTYPVSDFEIVMGKYGALLAQLATLFFPTLAYLGVLHLLGGRIDFGIVFSGTLGFFLLGAAYLAMGLFFSSVTENQMLAGGLSFSLLMVFWVLEWLAGLAPRPWGTGLSAFSPFVHYRDFALGIVDLQAVVFFLSAAAFFLFLALRTVETRNWKG